MVYGKEWTKIITDYPLPFTIYIFWIENVLNISWNDVCLGYPDSVWEDE